ncbi:MAG TPA: ABC transporter substrate-binding protein [Thermodesulfovibrionales bacterium]|nr:ABC transporter substrate-binding protein [Thermodesulfovibrionales bacterium]
MKKVLIGFHLIIFFILPLSLYAGVPQNTVEGHVNNVLNVLRDPAMKGDKAKKAKKEKVRAISEKMFDFNELSRRTLAMNWKNLNPDQQKEFIDLYKDILEDAYMDRIMSYSDEKVVFSKEIMLSDDTAEVQSNIITKKAEIPIYYRVILKDGNWRVYDVIIEGVSLIKNYRTQFRDILANKSPEELLKVLRKKVGKA